MHLRPIPSYGKRRRKKSLPLCPYSRILELFNASFSEAEEQGELPRFSGPPNSEKIVVKRYYDFVQWFAPLGLRPKEINLSARYAWNIELSNNLQLNFGQEKQADTLARRSQRFVEAFPKIFSRWGKQIDYVDLCYPNGFAIHLANQHFPNDNNPLSHQPL